MFSLDFLKKTFTTRNGLLNLLWVAAPVVAGVASGGVFTVPVLVSAVGSIAGKLAQSPINHEQPKPDQKQ